MTDAAMGIPLNLLIIEDSLDDAEILLWEIRRGGFDVTWERVDTAKAMEEALSQRPWDFIISDYVMPTFSGLAALELLQNRGVDIPFVIVSGRVGEDIAVAAMRAGANDYLMKGNLARLVPVIKRELAEVVARRDRLQEQKELYLLKQAIDRLPLGLTITDLNRRILYTNPAEAAMHGYTVGDLIGQSVRMLAPTDSWEEKSLHKLPKNSVFSREVTNQRKDGSTFMVHRVANVVTAEDGETPVAMISICEDITERKMTEITLLRQMTAIESAMDGIAITDQRGRFTYVNQAFASIFGHNLTSDLVGQGWESLLVESDQKRLREEIESQIRNGGNWRGELTGCRAVKFIFPLEATITRVEGNGFVCVVRDISERKLTEERLHYMSTHDVLTGFYNRGYVEGELDRLDRSRQYPVSIIVADVDCLKKVNDSHGHQAGDELLRLAAQGIAGAFRAEDIVARYGGDEFIVLLPETDVEAAARAVRRIKESVARLNETQREFTVSLSLGTATALAPGGLTEAVCLADQRMYADKQAKRCGRSEPSNG